jgi:hypothetical protein
MDSKTITHKTFSQLVDDGVIRHVVAVAEGGSWHILVEYGRVQRYLRSTNGDNVRTWSKIDTLVKYLAAVGIRKWGVDASGFIPGEGLTKRPDRRRALKDLHSQR